MSLLPFVIHTFQESGLHFLSPLPPTSLSSLGPMLLESPPNPRRVQCCLKPPSRRPLLWPVSASWRAVSSPRPAWPGMLQRPGAQSNLSSSQGELLHTVPKATAFPRPSLQPSDSADLRGPPPREMPPGVKHVKTELIPSPEPCLRASGPALLSARRTLATLAPQDETPFMLQNQS